MRRATKRGFTLIELLVVISIIALLVGILMPSLHRAILLARAASSRTAVQTLSGGAMGYWNANHAYPLQEGYTGNEASVEFVTALEDGEFLSLSGDQKMSDGSPSDLFGADHKSILYYPSQPGNNGSNPAAAFDPTDNSSLDGGTSLPTGNGEGDYLWNSDLSLAYNYDTFLLISAGIDREYFTDDDVTNINR